MPSRGLTSAASTGMRSKPPFHTTVASWIANSMVLPSPKMARLPRRNGKPSRGR